ncbi:TPA: fimbrial protein [Stenotrophomonas maltophilia]|uniref:fimbrial protein n=1 Tax=Stenotrophomonas sp. PE591 TaxID=1812490 RepID=UPI001BAE9175|nr:fimbrial protein [Stenotrophomonas sp. PE591]MBS3726912.1 hypothetical protein [Stenotrophomonas sp. PE591]
MYKRFIKVAALCSGMFLAADAMAVCYEPAVNPEQFPLPHARLVVNAADVGEALSPWLSSPQKAFVTCAAMGSLPHRYSLEWSGTEVRLHDEGGETYGVFDTGLPGVGIIFAVEAVFVYDPGAGDSGTRRYPVRAGRFVNRISVSQHFNVGHVLRARYIKLDNTPRDGRYTIPAHRVGYANVYQNDANQQTQYQEVPDITFEVVNIPLCHVRPKTVHMGVGAIASYTRPGAASPTVPYTVELDCEVGAGRVNYYVEALTTAIHDRAAGILEVEGGAQGVGLQLLDKDGDPVPIGTEKPFGNSAADGLRSENFGARYIRTAVNARDMRTGEANTSVRYRIDYP